MMSEARYKAANKYLQEMAKLMNLSHFDVYLERAYTDTVDGVSVAASSKADTNISSIAVRLSTTFFESNGFSDLSEDQRNTICHELVHAHVDLMVLHTYRNATIRDLVGSQVFAMFEETGNNVMEQMVNQISNGWATSLPLPPRFPK